MGIRPVTTAAARQARGAAREPAPDPRERARHPQPHGLPRPRRRRDDLAPASERALRAAGPLEGRPFEAPADTVSRSLEHLRQHRRELPTQTFVFVLSDFLVPPDGARVAAALEQRWELVPVVIQDPVWERSFPDVGA